MCSAIAAIGFIAGSQKKVLDALRKGEGQLPEENALYVIRSSSSMYQLMTYIFDTARIAFDELILQVRFRIPMIFNKRLEDIRWDEVEVCPRLIATAHNARLQNLLLCNLSHKSSSKCPCCTIPKRCHWCATEYLLEAHSFKDLGLVVVVTAWKNLGTCRTPFDPKWQEHAGSTLLPTDDTQNELKGIRDSFELLADVVGTA